MNLILEDVERIPYFTNMRSVMDAVRLDLAEYIGMAKKLHPSCRGRYLKSLAGTVVQFS